MNKSNTITKIEQLAPGTICRMFSVKPIENAAYVVIEANPERVLVKIRMLNKIRTYNWEFSLMLKDKIIGKIPEELMELSGICEIK
jgi:hypothetical protein